MNDTLDMYSKQIQRSDGQEKMRYVIAKDVDPWKTWKNSSSVVRFNKTNALVKKGWLKTFIVNT